MWIAPHAPNLKISLKMKTFLKLNMAKIQYMTKRCSHMPGPQETQLYIGKIENNVHGKISHKGKMNLQGLIILSQIGS